jgi:hypothetical protein
MKTAANFGFFIAIVMNSAGFRSYPPSITFIKTSERRFWSETLQQSHCVTLKKVEEEPIGAV